MILKMRLKQIIFNAFLAISKYSKVQSSWSIFGFKYPFSTETTVGEYKSTMKRVNDLTVGADDYPTRLATS